MKKIFTGFILFLLAVYHLPAQETTDPEELFSDGEFFFAIGQEALYNYLQLLEQFPDNANFNFKAGMTYLQIPGQEHLAIPYLEKTIGQTTIKYKKRSFEEENAPHYAYLLTASITSWRKHSKHIRNSWIQKILKAITI